MNESEHIFLERRGGNGWVNVEFMENIGGHYLENNYFYEKTYLLYDLFHFIYYECSLEGERDNSSLL